MHGNIFSHHDVDRGHTMCCNSVNLLQQCQSVATKYYSNAYLRAIYSVAMTLKVATTLMQCYIAWQL